MFAKIGCRAPSGVSVGRNGSVAWPISRSAQQHRQRLSQRRARVSARPEAVVSAEHDEARSFADAFDDQFLLLRADVAAVEIAENEHVELVDRFGVLGDGRELEIVHVRAFEEHVRPGLHQGVELEVGVFRQKPIDQRAVFRPQGAFEVQHLDARLDHQRNRRPLVVFDDFLFGQRRDFDRISVLALHRGAKIERDRLRAAGLADREFLLGDFLAVFLQLDLHDAARQARCLRPKP